jgi:hypothetical protein
MSAAAAKWIALPRIELVVQNFNMGPDKILEA